ncbi:LysR family transcriptional regulator [Paraburkholderia hospita]|uniref:LysR family transcriptional regulator n=1 Tax=Paraburkholderia hospita TaxID=169430 RepID=UPI003ECCBFCB
MQWKRGRTRFRELTARGVGSNVAAQTVGSYWRRRYNNIRHVKILIRGDACQFHLNRFDLGLSNINDIALFVGVVNAGSFTVAARQMGLTRSAVGKGIVRLEERLAVRLLNRTPRSLSLTDDGQVFYARCVRILEDLEEAESAMALRSETPNGLLRVSLPITLGQRHVLPVIESFLEAWPQVSAEVTFTDRFVDLIEEGIDIALRIGEPRVDSRLITRTVAQQILIPCASPAYLNARGVPQCPGDLKDHNCLFFLSAGRRQPWLFVEHGEKTQFNGPGRLQMDSTEALRAAAVDDFGVVYLPTYLVEEDIRAGRLTPLLEAYRQPGDPIRVVYPTRRHLSPKVRLFIDLLTSKWGDVAPWDRNVPQG